MMSGGGPTSPPGCPWYGPAAASAAMVSGGSGVPLLTPLQSLNLPYSHSSCNERESREVPGQADPPEADSSRTLSSRERRKDSQQST